jgi:hypothetical protein
MDKASAYGAGDCRFESYQGHCFFFRPCALCCRVLTPKSLLVGS